MLFGQLKGEFYGGHEFALNDCALKSFFIFERTNAVIVTHKVSFLPYNLYTHP